MTDNVRGAVGVASCRYLDPGPDRNIGLVMGRKRKVEVLEDDSKPVGGSSAGASSAPTLKRACKVAPKIAEKRAARIRTTCPKNIQERVGRVMSQRCGCSPLG